MIIAFTLSMPCVGSWNGKWTGAENLYCRVINFKQRYGTSKKATELTERLLSNRVYYYNFGDGWEAAVTVEAVDAKKAAKLRKGSRGFCGYDWMIANIVQHGKIVGSTNI